jgi:MarR family transcriptional regulator, transcriptional regulator for hemolysin
MQLSEQDRALAFAISDAAYQIRKAFNARARHLNLTQAQYRTLIQVHRQPGITQRDLAQLLEVKPITLTRQLDILAANGLVERRVNSRDRRSFQLYLTPKAEPVQVAIHTIGAQVMEQSTAGLSVQDKTRLTKMLLKIKANLMLDEQA